MDDNLYRLQELVYNLNQTNSSNDKIKLLVEHSECKEILEWIYNPYKQYYVTSANLKKNKEMIGTFFPASIFVLLEKLTNREITGHDAIKMVNGFIREHSQYETLIYNILDKDLQVRIGSTLINKAFPGLIPTFDIALAKNYKDFSDKIDFEKEDWWASHKLDGCRCITIIDNQGSIKFYSREGREFLVLDVLKTSIEKLGYKNLVLDGEICIIDSNGNEDFQSIMKEIRRKDHTIQCPKYKIFDCLTFDEFQSRKSDVILSERYSQRLQKIGVQEHLEILKQVKVISKEHLSELIGKGVENGWEGLILRNNVGYEGKRTNNLLKVKQFFDAEYVVLAAVNGLIDDGHGNKVEGLSRVDIMHKGNIVGVGSGFKFEERIRYLSHPEEIIGKIITVKFFEETINQQGGISLRFPTLKVIHGETREV